MPKNTDGVLRRNPQATPPARDLFASYRSENPASVKVAAAEWGAVGESAAVVASPWESQ